MKLLFEHPWVLASTTLIIPALLLLHRAKANRRRVSHFFDVKVGHFTTLLEATKIASLILLILAAATPYIEYSVPREVPIDELPALAGKKVLHVVLLDVSRSMTYPLGFRTRFDAALEAVERYLSSLTSDDVVHLAVFSASVRMVCQGEPAQCIQVLKGLSAGERYTAVGDALLYAASVAEASPYAPVIVLVSDGSSNYGSDPIQVAETLKSRRLPLIVVAVGDSEILPSVAGSLNAKLYRVDEFTVEAVGSLASKVAQEARYGALSARGEAFIEEVRRSYAPAQALLALAIIMLLLQLIDGV